MVRGIVGGSCVVIVDPGSCYGSHVWFSCITIWISCCFVIFLFCCLAAKSKQWIVRRTMFALHVCIMMHYHCRYFVLLLLCWNIGFQDEAQKAKAVVIGATESRVLR